MRAGGQMHGSAKAAKGPWLSVCSLQERKRLASVCRVARANLRQEAPHIAAHKHAVRSAAEFSEIFLNGPVVAPVLLLNDFLVYRRSNDGGPASDGLRSRSAHLP